MKYGMDTQWTVRGNFPVVWVVNIVKMSSKDTMSPFRKKLYKYQTNLMKGVYVSEVS